MRFSHESPLQSCRVTKELVNSIENYLTSRLSALTGSEQDRVALKESLIVFITDSFGTERLSSIAEYSQPRFSDDVSRVVVKITQPYATSFQYFEFEVRFDIQKIHSRLRLTYDGDNAREFVVGVEQGIKACIATEGNFNYLFHPPPELDGALWVITPMLPALDILAYNYHSALGYLALVFTMCIYAYVFVAKRMRPYTTFDSNASERQNKRWSWFLSGFSTFVVFSSLLAAFRDAVISSLSK